MRFRLPSRTLKRWKGVTVFTEYGDFLKRFPKWKFSKTHRFPNEDVPVWTGDLKNAWVISIKNLSHDIGPSPHGRTAQAQQCLVVAFSKRFGVDGWKRRKNGGVDVKLFLLRFEWTENGGFWKRISADVTSVYIKPVNPPRSDWLLKLGIYPLV